MTDRLIRITTALAVTAVAVVAASSRTSTLERRLASSTAMDAAQWAHPLGERQQSRRRPRLPMRMHQLIRLADPLPVRYSAVGNGGK